MGAWGRTVDEARALGLGEWIDADRGQLEERVGSAAHVGGVIDATAGVAQPARLARGVRRVALEMGIQIFERSPVLEVGGSRLTLRSAFGGGERVARLSWRRTPG